MTASLKLPRILASASRAGLEQSVSGSTLGAALEHLFNREPGLKAHLLDEHGEIRPHVLFFVDSERADLSTKLGENARIQVLQAVSGGSSSTSLVGRV